MIPVGFNRFQWVLIGTLKHRKVRNCSVFAKKKFIATSNFLYLLREAPLKIKSVLSTITHRVAHFKGPTSQKMLRVNGQQRVKLTGTQ